MTAGRRVAVTGLGAITPLGLTAFSSFESAVSGKSGVSTVTGFDPTPFDVRFAGQVKEFNLDAVVPKKEQKKMDRFIHLGMMAAHEAIHSSGIQWTDELKLRTGVFVGSGIGGLPLIEETHTTFAAKGPGRISPFFIPQVIPNMASGHISILHGLGGANFSIASACASGCHSIGEAANYIRLGMADVMVAGGTESAISPLGLGGFAAMKALSGRNDDPEKASRPWDKDRDGFVLAEGAGVLILEDLEMAKKRGATIYCEVTGYGVSSDAHHMTNPAPGGAGALRAMKMALHSSGIPANQIGYVNAHGTSTPAGDAAETGAIKQAFGDHAKSGLWVSSTKSMMGHALGAAGAIESVFSILSLYKNIVPPTINLDNPSEDCDLDYVPHQARERNLQHVLNNSFGFGGTNACLLFSKV
jgi:3-oxoacyl-[acyl-carrier-protein] synthase II